MDGVEKENGHDFLKRDKTELILQRKTITGVNKMKVSTM